MRVALDGYDEKKRFRAAGQNICLLIKALFLVWMDARRIRNVVTKIVARIQYGHCVMVLFLPVTDLVTNGGNQSLCFVNVVLYC